MELNKKHPQGRKPVSNREANAAKAELLDRLLAEAESSGDRDLFGPEGTFTRLKGALMERLLQAELSEHLERDEEVNSRNGYSEKTVQTESGPVRIRVPRDREGTFEPQLVKKGQRRLAGFDEKVLALYARGMTTRDIQAHLRELYGTEVSHELIATATDAILPELRAWQARPLEEVYAVIYLDALFVSVRDGQHVQKRAFYVALGVDLDGNRHVLGLWAHRAEGAKYWLDVLNELRQRGVQDVFFVCADGVAGIDRALEAAFPNAVHQTCVVHLLRNAMKFVSWSDRQEVASDLRRVYTAPNEPAALDALSEAETKWAQKYPNAVRTFRSNWDRFVPFLGYPQELRRMLYTTNVIESLNAQLRKALRNRGSFVNDEAAIKVIYLALKNAKMNWRPAAFWNQVRAQIDITFGNRVPA